MTENDYRKRKDQKRRICFCDQKATIQLGLRTLPYANVVLFGLVLFFLLRAAFSQDALEAKLLFIAAVSLFVFSMPVFVYVNNKKEMIAHRHTLSCSRRMALLSVLYMGAWSFFVIFDKENK